MYLEDSPQSRKKILIGRVREIIDISYKILIQKIGNGTINAWNEASFQLEFGSILKTVGNLYEFSTDDKFHMEFESGKLLNAITNKSKSKKARIDIYMEYKNPNLSVKTAIELKFFKRENHREPNNRYDVFQDIRNLEIYKNNDIDLCFFVLGTNHPHYFNAEQYSLDTSDFDFRQGSIYKKGTSLIYNTQKPYGAEIVLDSDYEFKWQEIGNFYFLKLEV